jgi:hypothetical protein
MANIRLMFVKIGSRPIEKSLAVFPSQAGMSLIKLKMGKPLTFFYSVTFNLWKLYDFDYNSKAATTFNSLFIFLFPWYQAKHPFPKFTSTLFFNVLLPPIILDSALALYDKERILFFELCTRPVWQGKDFVL